MLLLPTGKKKEAFGSVRLVVVVVVTMLAIVSLEVKGQTLYGFVVDGSGDPTTSNFYSFSTDGTSLATNVAALTNVVVGKASTTDSAGQVYWTSVSGYPENGILGIDVTSGAVIANVTLTSSEIVCLAANTNGESLAVVTLDLNNVGSLWTYFYGNGSLVLVGEVDFTSFFPSSSCVIRGQTFYSTLLKNTGSGFAPYLFNFNFSNGEQKVAFTALNPPSDLSDPISSWSVAGLQFDVLFDLITMFNWNDNNCSLAGIYPATGDIGLTSFKNRNYCSQQAAGGLAIYNESEEAFTWLMEATDTVFPTSFVAINGQSGATQFTTVPSFPFSYPSFASAGVL